MYLVNARQKLGYSQYRVASEAGICHQHYSRVENGIIGAKISFKTIYALAIALKIPFKVICIEEINYQKMIANDDNWCDESKF